MLKEFLQPIILSIEVAVVAGFIAIVIGALAGRFMALKNSKEKLL